MYVANDLNILNMASIRGMTYICGKWLKYLRND